MPLEMSELLALAARGELPVVVSVSAALGEEAEWVVGLRVTRSGRYLVQVRAPVRTDFACAHAPQQPQHSYAQVYSVIYDSGSVLRRAIFSSRETSPETLSLSP